MTFNDESEEALTLDGRGQDDPSTGRTVSVVVTGQIVEEGVVAVRTELVLVRANVVETVLFGLNPCVHDELL